MQKHSSIFVLFIPVEIKCL